MQEIFVDAGAWIAVNSERDQYHSAAAEYYRAIVTAGRTLVTTNLVIAEAYVLIRRAGGHAPAIGFLRALRTSARIERVYSDTVLESAAYDILKLHDDQGFSYTDAVSFACMRDRGIDEAFGFDRHFLTAGFTLRPSIA